jgi:hypothetical protein
MRKIGELKGKPIIEGNPNEVKKNQIHYKESDGNITLSERKGDNTLSSVTSGSGSGDGVKEYYYKFKDTAIPEIASFVAGITHITAIVNNHSGQFIENSQTLNIITNIMYTAESNIIQFTAFKYIDIEVYDINVPIDVPVIDKSGLGNLNERLYNLFMRNEEKYNQFKQAFELTFQEITKEEYESMITYKPE